MRARLLVGGAVVFMLLSVGCEQDAGAPPTGRASASARASAGASTRAAHSERPHTGAAAGAAGAVGAAAGDADGRAFPPKRGAFAGDNEIDAPQIGQTPPPGRIMGPRTLADLLAAGESVPWGLPKIDDERAAAAGVRKLAGKRIVIYTDLAAQPAVDELPGVFDQAVPQWCAYFGVPEEKLGDWRMTAYLMQAPDAFRALQMFPEDLPPFLTGYQRGYEIWLYEQPSDFYRRHLLLHEGTHGFMAWFVGGIGPPWYAEGMAELLGTHRWSEGKLNLAYFPHDKVETEMWGRVRLMRDEFAAGRGMRFHDVLALGPRAHLQVEPYGWSWGLAAFLHGHPKYRELLRQLGEKASLSMLEFNAALLDQLGDQQEQLAHEWELFAAEIDYGYDVERAAVRFAPGAPLPAAGQTCVIQAAAGWQSSGIRVEAGERYAVAATGKYVVGREPRDWICEPGGVTLRYYRGVPLGTLMATVLPDRKEPAAITPLATPVAVGAAGELRPLVGGTAYFRIQEFSGDLKDNAGTIEIRMAPLPAAGAAR